MTGPTSDTTRLEQQSRLERQSRLALVIGLAVALAGSVFGLVGGVYFGPVRGAEAGLIVIASFMCLALLIIVMRTPDAPTSWIPAGVSLYFLAHLVAASALAVSEGDRILRATPYLLWYFPLLCFHKLTDFGPYRVPIDRALTAVPLLSILLMTPRMIVGAEVAQINLLIAFFLSYAGFAYFLELFSRYRDRFVIATTRAATLEEMTRTIAESEHRYRTVYDLVPVLIWEEDWSDVKPLVLDLIAQGVTDFEAHFLQNPGFVERAIRNVRPLDTNSAGARMLGVGTHENLLAAHSRIVSSPSAVRVFRKALLAYATNRREMETDEVTFDLQSRKLHVVVKMALPDILSDETRVVLTQMDVTALRRMDERLRLLGQATNDAVWEHDLITDELWVGDGMRSRFGHRPETIMRLRNWADLLHPDDRQTVLQQQAAVIAGAAPEWTARYRFLRADGTYAQVRDRALILRNAAGRAERMIGSMMDITEQTELEEQLRQSQRLEAVGHLTGGVAHDFNNLLTVILGNAELLCDELTDPKLRQMAAVSLSAAERGAQLTGRLLAFARRKPLEPKPTDVNGLVEAMQPLVRRTLPESIEIKFMLDPDIGITEIDAGELDTAVLNLVVNARDAMPNGGKLTIETANVVLDSAYADRHLEVAAGDYVMICVSDTGKGMDSDTLRRAFEPFFTTKDVGKGSGLGLSMVFGFTKQSGGHIKIYSEPGEGTSVKLYFPRLRDAREAGFRPAAEVSLQRGTEHILIAEDDDLVLAHLRNQLVSLGYQVSTSMSGPEAMEVLLAHDDIEMLLTDIVMPGGMNGRELAERAQRARPSLRVLFTSGYTENAIVHQGRLDPGVALLSKPYTRVELATKVRRVLDEVRG